MGRKMVKMTRIRNEKTRITTYKKRKACLYKKASEFSTLCGVDTCVIVYGPSRAGEEMVVEAEVWPRDESKVREIISKYRDTASSSCIKTYTVEECLEKKNNNTKVEKSVNKYCPWDKKLDKCCLNELYAVFVAVGNKIQEAADRQTRIPDQLAGYNLEQHQLLFPMDHNLFSFPSFLNQMTPEMASFSNVTDQAMMFANGQNMFYGTCSDRTAYMEPIQWGLGNNTMFTDYPMRFNDLEDSAKNSM